MLSESRFPLPVASDADSGRYRVRDYVLEQSRYFRLETSGAEPSTDLFLVLSSGLDRESAVEHRLAVTAYDGGRPQLAARLDVVVIVADGNDHPPVLERSVYDATVAENCAVGTTLLRLHADDRDDGDNGRVVYSLLRTTPVTSACPVHSFIHSFIRYSLLRVDKRDQITVTNNAIIQGGGLAQLVARWS